jgi:hypothetical protein
MMEAARISETSVDIQLKTRQYIPEDSKLHTRRRENLKTHNAEHLSFLAYFSLCLYLFCEWVDINRIRPWATCTSIFLEKLMKTVSGVTGLEV